jgi:tetratricopeptide (TPR) repeat protein
MGLETPSRSLEALEQEAQGGGNPLAYIPLADALRAKGQYQRALETCHLGLSEYGWSVAGHILLAKIHFDMGKYDLAEAECQVVLNQAPQSLSARRLRIQLALRRRLYVRALEQIEDLQGEMGEDPELVAAFVEAQRGLAERFSQTLALAPPERGPDRPPSTRGELLEHLSAQPEVISCQVVPRGDMDSPLGEMLRAWEELESRERSAAIRMALLQSDSATLLIRDLGADDGSLVITLVGKAPFGAAKRLAEQFAALPSEGGNGQSPAGQGETS